MIDSLQNLSNPLKKSILNDGCQIKGEKLLAFLRLMRYLCLRGGLISFMFKGAIGIFAFSIFLFNCATPVTTLPPPVPPQPVLLPDLTISDMSLNEGGKVEVRISNIGRGPAPHHVGSLVIMWMAI